MPKRKKGIKRTGKIRKPTKKVQTLSSGTLATLIIFVAFVFLLVFSQFGVFRKEPGGPPVFVPPTISPEEYEIAKNKVTHQITVLNNQVKPANLKIKLHDQVAWINKDQQTHQISGEGWGNVPLEQGESFTQTFDQIGIFSYSCLLEPKLQGTIQVVEK